MMRYLGDGTYAELDASGMIRLFTTDGRTTQNEIFLEPEVYATLEQFVKTVQDILPQQWGR